MIYCLDLEGVLVPEIWIEVSKRTRIDELKITTRDEPDYDKLMRFRIGVLRRRGVRLADIQRVIGSMRPLPGAAAFLSRLRRAGQVIILSDTYYEFAGPLLRKLGDPTLFCNWLEVDRRGFLSGYRLRQRDGKRRAVRALKAIGFPVRAAGDSHNDLTMLAAADRGVLFNPPAAIRKANPRFPVANDYRTLYARLTGR